MIWCVPCSKAELSSQGRSLPDWSPKKISLKLLTSHSAGNPLWYGEVQVLGSPVSAHIVPVQMRTDCDCPGGTTRWDMGLSLWDWAHCSVTGGFQTGGGSVPLPTSVFLADRDNCSVSGVVCSLCRGALSFMGGFTCALLTILVAVSYFLPTALGGLWRCLLLGGCAVWVVTSLPSAAWLLWRCILLKGGGVVC